MINYIGYANKFEMRRFIFNQYPVGKIVPGTYHHFEGTIGTSMQHSKLYYLSGNQYFSYNVAWNLDATF